MYNFKNSFPPDFVYIQGENLFFPETHFAYNIFKQKFTVCILSIAFSWFFSFIMIAIPVQYVYIEECTYKTNKNGR